MPAARRPHSIGGKHEYHHAFEFSSPGDAISGTIRFDHAWTPANLAAAAGKPDWFTFQLGNFFGTAYPAADQVSIDYFLTGTQVATSTPTNGGFGGRITAAPDYTAVIPATTFDSIRFHIDVANVYDDAQAAFGVPTQVSGDYGQLMVFDFAPRAAPEPGSWALMLAALAGCGLLSRRSGAVRESRGGLCEQAPRSTRLRECRMIRCLIPAAPSLPLPPAGTAVSRRRP